MNVGQSYLYIGASIPAELYGEFALIDRLIIDAAQADLKAMRAVVANSSQQAFGEKRLLLIENGDQMNDQLQNTLLKLLEEPPSTLVVVVQVTRAEALLPTVRSRLHYLEPSSSKPAAELSATVTQEELRAIVDKAKDRKALTEAIETVRSGIGATLLMTPSRDLIVALNLLDRSVRRLGQNANQKLVIDALLLNWPLQSSRSE